MSQEVKRLYRSKKERMLAGVCGGLGEYFNIDPNLVRILFILFALVMGGGILLYIILWILIPEAPQVAGGAEEVPMEEAE